MLEFWDDEDLVGIDGICGRKARRADLRRARFISLRPVLPSSSSSASSRWPVSFSVSC